MMKPVNYKGIVQYKTYPRFERKPLNMDLDDSPIRNLIRNRRTRRERSSKRIHIDQLHPLLNLAAGRTGITGTDEEDFRSYPSAGARYPLELYLVSFKVEGLEKGIYHFSPQDGSLEVLWNGDFKNEIDQALNGAINDFKGKAKAFLIISSVEKRTTYKYGDDGKIFPYIEAGYLGANIILLLEEVGINTVVVGVQWCEEGLSNILDLNPLTEGVISGIVIL